MARTPVQIPAPTLDRNIPQVTGGEFLLEASSAHPTAYPADNNWPLLQITFDQLRTLVEVFTQGTALKAARTLQRDQSSVQVQLDKLNEHFLNLCGEILVSKTGRGQPFRFTSTGKDLVKWSQELLAGWNKHINERRQTLGQKLVVATTTFTLPLLAPTWNELKKIVGHDVMLENIQVRTKDFWKVLEDKAADLLLGAILSPPNKIELDNRYSCLEWQPAHLVHQGGTLTNQQRS